MPPSRPAPPCETPPAPRKLFLLRGEVARQLGVTPYRVLELEREGRLRPRRNGKNARQYAASEVAALAIALGRERSTAPTSGEVEATIADLAASGRSDAEIVRALRVPFALVARIRAETSGRGPRIDTPEEIEFRNRAERELEAERAQRLADIEARLARRKERR